MDRMVADLLEFTRTRFGDSIPIVRADTDVRRILHDVVTEVAASYPSSTLQVETGGDLRGRWDSARLTQALTNLVSNAVHHGSDKSPVKVVAHGGRNEVVISVHNEGPVIPQKDVAQLFKAMKHARGDGARDRRHLGLGLYIVDKIVAAHGGAIDVRSSREEGTSFTVHLPRQA
jgi:signal transduction histidine kinase